MPLKADRWTQFASTPHPWEQEAVNFLRDQLLDVEPNRVFALFEFASPDGTIGEVDALVLTQKGFFLVEIKSRPGKVTGDASTWTWVTPEGKRLTGDSPIFATNRKCKRLIDLLKRQKALRDHLDKLPYLRPLVFLSATGISVELEESAKQFVCTREGNSGTQRLLDALTRQSPAEHNDGRRRAIDAPLSRAIAQALAQAGIRPSMQHRRFANSYELESLLLEGPTYQDWLAHHVTADKVKRRIRIYPIATTTDIPTRQMNARAARREFVVLQGVDHQGILRALDFQEGDQGPGVVFEFHPDDIRLDHFLRDHGEKLNLTERLAILRQIAEATQHAHDRRLVHRSLTPQSVLIRRLPKGGFATRLYNWQTAARDATTGATVHASSSVYTQHIEPLVDPAAVPYLAPETVTDTTVRAEHLDMFGLGVIAWVLFAGRPPADDRPGLLERLRRDDGLLLSSAIDNVATELVELVHSSTRPKVPDRYQTVREFLKQLDEVENQLTRPADEVHDNPTAAKAGQRFEGGWVIKNRLGQGSTAVVFLVERDEGKTKRQCVLKLALDPDKNATLRGELEVLLSLRHEAIVECVDQLECSGHVGLLLARAGEESVATRLRKVGRFEVEILHRFGDDLLSAVHYLEEQGVFHRDIKPDNLGIAARGRGDYQHLVLFDFSLAKAPLSQTQVGTRAYLDPLLGQKDRRQYDPAAERYAVAVTLFEMATGRLPKWGDGRTAPELSDSEVDLSDEGLFDSSARDALVAFFSKALRRNTKQRFDNTEEMRRAWRQVFESLSAPTVKAESESISLHSPVQLLGLSTRALTILERSAIDTVHQLLRVPQGRLTKGRGVGAKTRDELLRALDSLRARFPAIQPGEDPPAAGKPSVSEPEEPANDALPAPRLDQLAESLLPVARTRAKSDQQPVQLVRSLLDPRPAERDPLPWPTQTDVAKQHKCTTVLVNQTLAKARARWRKNGSLTVIRDSLLPRLVTQGGIAGLAEAVSLIADGHSEGLPDTQRTRCARIVLRAAIEAEQALDEPRFAICRRQDRVWLVVSEDGDRQPLDAGALLRYAQELGRRARDLAFEEPLPAPTRVLDRLQQVKPPEGVPPLSPERLVRLAATAADVAVSGKLEVYPRGMAADRALKLAHGALLGSAQLTLLQIRERVASRYPEAKGLPEKREEVADMLQAVAPDLLWDAEQGAFRFQSATKPQLTGERTLPARVTPGSLPPPESPDVVEAREFDVRLEKAREKFLVLTAVREDHETVLHRLQDRFAGQLRLVSCERLFLEQLRRASESERIEWKDVLGADAEPAGSPNNMDLRQLVREAAGQLGDLIGRDTPEATILLTRIGVLARYGLLEQVVERLRDRAYARPGTDGAISGMWLLVASTGAQERPTVDGVPIPVPGGRSDYVEVPRAWVHLVQRDRASGA